MSIADPNKTILTGENPFIRLSLKDGDPNSTDASYWRIIFSPVGPGHVRCCTKQSYLVVREERSEHRFTQGMVAIGGDRVSIAGRVKVPRTSGGAG